MGLALCLQGFRFRPAGMLRLADPELVGIYRLLVYPLAGQALSQARFLLEYFRASFRPSGGLTAISYASRIVQSLSAVLVGGVVTSALPLVSRFAIEAELENMKEAIRCSVRLLLLISLPVAAWLIAVGRELMILVFERGQFTRNDAELAASLIALMTPYILLSRLVGLTQVPFYATLKTRTPFYGSALAFAGYAAVAPLLVGWAGIYGLSLASSLASLLAALAMIKAFHNRFGALGWSGLGRFAVSAILASVMAGLASAPGHQLCRLLAVPGMAGKALAVFVPSVFFLATLVIASLALGLVGREDLRSLRTGRSLRFKENP
ncbi:MAG: lipid II flippase MurJ, partial [Acidobacteriota bacterium]